MMWSIQLRYVNGAITGGNSQITMGNRSSSQTVEDAQDLANILKSGKLNAPARIVQEQVVGPTLGRQGCHWWSACVWYCVSGDFYPDADLL